MLALPNSAAVYRGRPHGGRFRRQAVAAPPSRGSTQLPELLNYTRKAFAVETVLADKAYESFENYDVMAKFGIATYIPFKSTHTQNGGGRSKKGELVEGKKLWSKMFHLFQYHSEEFLAHYHQRSNVETVFHMIKSKFGGEVRSKTETAALNEVLCKIVCHNICCLISAMFELGLDLEPLLPPKPGAPGVRPTISRAPMTMAVAA